VRGLKVTRLILFFAKIGGLNPFSVKNQVKDNREDKQITGKSVDQPVDIRGDKIAKGSGNGHNQKKDE